MSADFFRGLFLYIQAELNFVFLKSRYDLYVLYCIRRQMKSGIFRSKNAEKIGMIIACMFCGNKSLNLILYAGCLEQMGQDMFNRNVRHMK